nr:DUF3343 domain-containing protein [Propionibacterium sp.]
MSASHSVVLVYTVAHAIRIERLLAARGAACRLIPVPRHLSSDCGVCVRIDRADTPLARRVIAEAGLDIEGIAELR